MPEQYQEFLISDFKTAKYLEKNRWLAPADAFPVLLNAEVEKGIIKRRRGTSAFKTFGGWVEVQPAGDVERLWATCVAMDADGSNIIAGVFQGDAGTDRLYTSSDSGGTWTERRPAGDADKSWNVAASDSDGSFLVAAVWAGRLYTSADSGATWTERQPAGAANKNWRSVACDNDGSVIVAAVSNGRIYVSEDSGVNWGEVQPDGAANRGWADVACSSDGSAIVAIERLANQGKVFLSGDTGATWSDITPSGASTNDYISVAVDDDASCIILGEQSGRLWYSVNTGSSFSELRPHEADRNDNWLSVAISADGTFIMAAVQRRVIPTAASLLWYSDDSGATWTSKDFDIDEEPTIYVDCDSDGSHMVAANGEYVNGATWGRLYVYSPALPIVGFGQIPVRGYVDVLVCDTDNVHHLHSDGETTLLGPATAFTGDEDDHFWFQDYNGSLYFVNGVDAIYKYTSGYTAPYNVPAMVTGDTAIQTCLMLFQYKNRIIIVSPKIGDVWYPDYIYWTDVLLDNVGATNYVRCQQSVTPISGGYIGDVPVIFCLDGSIWHIDYTQNSDTPFTWTRRQLYHGGRAKMGTVHLNNKLATMGLTRMIEYDGYEAQDFDLRIRGFYDDLDDGKILWSYGHRFLDRNWAGWAYTRSGQTDHDRILFYNIDEDNFCDADIAVNSLFSVKAPWLASGGTRSFPIADSDFVEIELGGTKTGKVLQINTGYQDEGSNIATDIRSAQLNPFQKEGFKVKLESVAFLIEAAKGEGMAVSFYKDDSATAFRTVQIDSPAATKSWQVAYLDGEVGDFFRIKIVMNYEAGITASDDFKIYAMKLRAKRADRLGERYEYSA